MSATMAIESCPENENSTDCLLRVLLGVIDTQFNAEDSKFDWDPITFAFTVPIGILALFFTIFLFFQAALASGPGRRKSNGRTIGKWASKTRREWNWQDLNVVSIARTPVLRTKNLGDILNKNKSPEKNGATPKTAEKTIRPQSSQESENAETTATTGQTWARLFPSRWKTAILPSRQRNVEAAAATWLRFLEHLGLEKLHIDDKDLETTAADYLPDDVLAVPAYADVGFVVVMAAVSGAHSFTDTTSLYPVIVGEDFQFDFRQHQTLGTVGAFMKYEKGVKGRIEPSHDQIMLAIRHARGEVEVGAFGQTSSPDDDKQKLPNCKEALSVNAISQSEPFGILKRLTEHQCKRGYALCKADLYIQEDEHHLLWPLLAKTPKHVPAIFPSEHSRVPNILTILALNSRFWSRPRETLLSNNDPRELLAGASSRINHGGAFVQHVDYKDLEYVTQLLLPKEQWNAQQEVPPNFEGLERSNLDDEDCTIVLTQIFQASLRLLYGFDDFQIWFNSMYPLRRQFFRMLVLLQLQQVDKWLAQKNRENCDVSCRILSLHFTTLALLDAEKAIEDNRFGAISSESIPFSIWRDLHFADSRQKDIIVRHKKTIQTLGAFFELLQGLGDKKTLPSLKVYGSDNLYWGNICYILKNQLGFLNEFHWVLNRDLEVHDEVLRRVGKVLDSCHESILAYGKDKPNEDKIGEHEASEDKPNEDKPDEDKTSEYEPSGKENSNEDKPDIETTEEDKQIGDALIWRCILISLLFWTVPDSSKMISSGVWEHVIPII